MPQAVCGQPPIWSRRWGSDRRARLSEGAMGVGIAWIESGGWTLAVGILNLVFGIVLLI